MTGVVPGNRWFSELSSPGWRSEAASVHTDEPSLLRFRMDVCNLPGVVVLIATDQALILFLIFVFNRKIRLIGQARLQGLVASLCEFLTFV